MILVDYDLIFIVRIQKLHLVTNITDWIHFKKMAALNIPDQDMAFGNKSKVDFQN